MELTINDKVFSILKAQFLKTIQDIANELPSNLSYVILKEQDFMKKKSLDKNNVFFVIKFELGTLFYGSTIAPISINAISEENGFLATKKILEHYATAWNLEAPLISVDNFSYIQQAYTSPKIMQNFINVGSTYRSSLIIQGTFVFAENISDLKLFLINDEIVEALGFQMNFSTSTHPIAFYGHEAVKTINEFSTTTISFATMSKTSVLYTKMLQIAMQDYDLNEKFKFKIKIGEVIMEKEMVLVSLAFKQNKGEVPQVNLAFTL